MTPRRDPPPGWGFARPWWRRTAAFRVAWVVGFLCGVYGIAASVGTSILGIPYNPDVVDWAVVFVGCWCVWCTWTRASE